MHTESFSPIFRNMPLKKAVCSMYLLLTVSLMVSQLSLVLSLVLPEIRDARFV